MSTLISVPEFLGEARKLIGVPFIHQGHSAKGVDCLGLLYVAATQAGLQIERLPGARHHQWNYGRHIMPSLLEKVRVLCTPTDVAVPGCLLFFQFPGKRNPQHFAICAGDTMIHAHAMRRMVVEHGYRAQWVRWTHSKWLLNGIQYG